MPDDARTMVDRADDADEPAPASTRCVEHVEVLALGNLDPAHPLRHPQRLRRHRHGRRARTMRRSSNARASGIQALNVKFGAGARRPLLPVPSRPPVERAASTPGWAGSASAARSRSSTACCAAPPTRASPPRSATLDVLPSVRYCITLDSDTRLPRDAARRLIGIIAHPLNRPRFDPASGRVTEGYGILQPRVSVTMASAAGSLFARTYAGHTGVDPYTTAVSDVYQDLFGEGIFTGKGLYDVDAFAAALEGRVPENALLSHDLFEGLYAAHGARDGRRGRRRLSVQRPRARAPAAPLGARRLADPVVAVAVRARRARAGAQPPAAHRALEDPRQPAAQPAAAGDARAAAHRAGRCCPATPRCGRPPAWPRLAFPLRCRGRSSCCAARRRRRSARCLPAHGGWRTCGRRRRAARCSSRSWRTKPSNGSHAIGVTLVRLGVTHRRLLEWETAAASAARGGTVRLDVVRQGHAREPGDRRWRRFPRWPIWRPSALPLALPIAAAWVAAPVVAFALSRPTARRASPLDADGSRLPALRSRGRPGATSTTSSPRRPRLPPDNVQLNAALRPSRTARRPPTSAWACWPRSRPTISASSTRADLVRRIDATLTTIERLENVTRDTC